MTLTSPQKADDTQQIFQFFSQTLIFRATKEIMKSTPTNKIEFNFEHFNSALALQHNNKNTNNDSSRMTRLLMLLHVCRHYVIFFRRLKSSKITGRRNNTLPKYYC